MKASPSLRRHRQKLTYGNIVSTLALFIALGGVSYAAATLPKNSVGTKQIKKNAVTSAKIKKSAVTGSKIKNGTITGSKVNLSTLGTVPSATNATTADHLSNSIDPKLTRLTPSASDPTDAVALAAATKVPIADNGTVSAYAKCFTVGSTLTLRVFAETSQNGALLLSGTLTLAGTPNYLDSTTPEMSRMLSAASAGTNSVGPPLPPFLGTATLLGPDGKGLQLSFDSLAKSGAPIFGNGPYGVGDSCLLRTSGDKISIG